MALGSARGESEPLHPDRNDSAGGARPDQLESQETQPAEAELENASGFSILSQPPAGSVTNNGDGTFSYNPGTDFADLGIGASRTVNFTFLLAGSEVVSATVTVTGTSDGPIATDVVYNSLGAPEPDELAGDAARQADPVAASEEPLSGSADPLEVDDLGDLAFSADPEPQDAADSPALDSPALDSPALDSPAAEALAEAERKPLSELSVSELLSPEPETPEPSTPEASSEAASPETDLADADAPEPAEPEPPLWNDLAPADEGAQESTGSLASDSPEQPADAPAASAEAAPALTEPGPVDHKPASPPDDFDPWADWDQPAAPDSHGAAAPDAFSGADVIGGPNSPGGPDPLGAQADATPQEADPASAGDAWAPAAAETPDETPAEDSPPADGAFFGDALAPDTSAEPESTETFGDSFGSPPEPVADPPAQAPEAENPAGSAGSFFDAFPSAPATPRPESAMPQPESPAPAAESGDDSGGAQDLWGDISAPTDSDDWADLAGELAEPSPEAVAAATAPDSRQTPDVTAPEAVAAAEPEPVEPEMVEPEPVQPEMVAPESVAPDIVEPKSAAPAGPDAAGCIVSQPSAGRAIDNGDGTFDFDPGDDFDDLQPGETRQVSFDVRLLNGDDYRATVTVADDGTGPFARDVDFERKGDAAPAVAPAEPEETPLAEAAAAPAEAAPDTADDPWADFKSDSAPEAEQPLAETPQGFADIGEDALQQEMTEGSAPAQAPDPLPDGDGFAGGFWGEEAGTADSAPDLAPVSQEPAATPAAETRAPEAPALDAATLDAPAPDGPEAAAPAPNLDALPRLVPDSPPDEPAPADEAAPLAAPDVRPDTLQLSGVTAGPGAGGWDIQLTTGEILEERSGCVVLSLGAAGSLRLEGSNVQISFNGIERIVW